MKMRVKMGTGVPKMGTVVHPEDLPADYRAAMAMALHAELGSTHRAIKSAMRWTGASERTVKYWFAGERGPSGEHLVSLARHSDAVLIALLALSDRLIVEEVEHRERR
ncbi:XRE family transcriptional regulator [Cereibacter sphaeroides]|uniref:XRE family transcriptional regulator n=1 Tax=Cereibacter johrii TaxID=445629 RepID=UPI0010CA2E63|nr:XRE family transcriptional regulator [Cereibacter sphaeroides]